MSIYDDFNKLTIIELKQIAKNNLLSGYHKFNKNDLIKFLITNNILLESNTNINKIQIIQDIEEYSRIENLIITDELVDISIEYICLIYIIAFINNKYNILKNIDSNISIDKKLLVQYKRDLNFKDYESLFHTACRCGDLNIIKYLINLYYSNNTHTIINIKEYYNLNLAFKLSCSYGNIEIVKYLLEMYKIYPTSKIDIHNTQEEPFITSCVNERIDIIKYLLDISESYSGKKINIHIDNEYIFRRICEHGKIKIAKYIISISESYSGKKIDIHSCNNYSFRNACLHKNIEIVKYLVSLDSDVYKVNIHNNNLISYKIINPFVEAIEHKDYDKLFNLLCITKSVEIKCDSIRCSICLDDENYERCISFNCHNEHIMHIECAYIWYSKNIKKCVICKSKFDWVDCNKIISI